MNSTHIQLIARRTSALYVVIAVLGLVIVGRLFQIQVVQHDYYRQLALEEHESKFSIPASRGTIYARDGVANRTPLVLNEVLPTVYVDPLGIEDSENDPIATELAAILDVPKNEIMEMLERNDSRYQIVKKQVPYETAQQIVELDLPGVGLTDESYRVYPQGQLASQTLGFVNNDGVGQYGVEEFLNSELGGTNGRFEAVTDAYGIPLTTSEQNIVEAPQDGDEVTLTLDVNIQRFVEQALKKGVEESKGSSGSAIVMDPNTGAVLAMANYPTYDPTDFTTQDDFSVFLNAAATQPYETGSGMKVLTMAAALNEGAVTPQSTYYDSGSVQVDDRRIENAGGGGGGTRTMTEVIQKSVNTGVVHALQQIGGGEINDKARNTLYEYFTQRYGFGLPTGVGIANEAGGIIFSPTDGQGNNVRYANMTFGQGLTVTMLQMAAAVSAVVNGGNYYQPYVVHSMTAADGQETVAEPQVIRKSIISEKASKDLRGMMQSVVQAGGGLVAKRDGYTIGGKTGTSQVLDEETGEYSDEREIGSFIGFGASAGKPDYVIMTRVDEPQIPGYAGTVAAAPIFADISNFMIDYLQIPPN